MKLLYTLAAASFPLYFDEGEPDPTPAVKTFTQEEVNSMLAGNKKTLQADLAKKTQALVDAQTNADLTQDEKDALAVRVNDLESLMMTDKELAARDKKKAATEYAASLEKETAASKKWKGLHDGMLVTNGITQAALVAGQKAINPSQLVALFAKDASVVDTDGVFSVQLSVPTVGTDGVTTSLVLDPAAAIKEYASRPEYANLFEDPSKEGLNKRRVPLKQGTLPTSMADYKANREELIK